MGWKSWASDRQGESEPSRESFVPRDARQTDTTFGPDARQLAGLSGRTQVTSSEEITAIDLRRSGNDALRELPDDTVGVVDPSKEVPFRTFLNFGDRTIAYDRHGPTTRASRAAGDPWHLSGPKGHGPPAGWSTTRFPVDVLVTSSRDTTFRGSTRVDV